VTFLNLSRSTKFSYFESKLPRVAYLREKKGNKETGYQRVRLAIWKMNKEQDMLMLAIHPSPIVTGPVLTRESNFVNTSCLLSMRLPLSLPDALRSTFPSDTVLNKLLCIRSQLRLMQTKIIHSANPQDAFS
jgi:hypothetical protein